MFKKTYLIFVVGTLLWPTSPAVAFFRCRNLSEKIRPYFQTKWEEVKAHKLKTAGKALGHGAKALAYPVVAPVSLAKAFKALHRDPPRKLSELESKGRLHVARLLKEDGTHAILFMLIAGAGMHPLVVSEEHASTPEDELMEKVGLLKDNREGKNILQIALFDPNSPDATMSELAFTYRFDGNKNSKWVIANTADEITQQIVLYVEKHGPIDGLIVEAHGSPGILYSKSKFLDKNSFNNTALQGYFVKDAKIVVNSCYTGSVNMESPIVGTGTEFLQGLGRAFLSDGGTVHAFRRASLFTAPENMPEEAQEKYYEAAWRSYSQDKANETIQGNFWELGDAFRHHLVRLFQPQKFNSVKIPRQTNYDKSKNTITDAEPR